MYRPVLVMEMSEGPKIRVRLPDKVTPHRILILSRAENARLTLVRWMLISAAIPLSASASLAPGSGRYLHSNLFLNMLDIVRPKDMHMEAPPRVRQSAHRLRYCGRYMCRPPTVGTSSEVGSSGTVSFIRTDTGISGWLALLFGASIVQILRALTLRLGFFGSFRSLPVFRTSLLYDGLGSIKGVNGYPLGISSATDLAEPRIFGGRQEGAPYDNIAGRALSPGSGE